MDTIDTLPARAHYIGWNQLLDWQRDTTRLAFVYARSLGGLIQTGHCRVAALSAELLTLDAAGSKLSVIVAGARFEAAPQVFFTPDLLRHFSVEGVALHLPNHDWMFLSQDAIPDNIALGARS